jgi:hypothetical protein
MWRHNKDLIIILYFIWSILCNWSFSCSLVQCYYWLLMIKSSACLNKSLNIFKYCCVLFNRQINIPRKSSESLGAASGAMRDIESNNITLFWAYLGHTKKKWYGSSISNPQLQDGSSSTKRLKCRCAFNLLQPIRSLARWILKICHQRWTTTSSLVVGNDISISVQMNLDLENCEWLMVAYSIPWLW